MNRIIRATRFVPRAFVAAPAEPRLPFRLWMTGSLAVVMAALIPMRDIGHSARAGQTRLLRHSPFGVVETLARIETTARGQGVEVLARVGGARPAIVLASSVGGTLVVMDDADSDPTVPLGLLVRDDGRGGADVLGMAGLPAASPAWGELPPAVIQDIEALPLLVERALA